MPTFEVVPQHTFSTPSEGTGIVARETLARQRSISEVQLPVCALNAPLRFGYGRNRVGALLLQPVVYGTSLLQPYIVGQGPIQAIDAVEFEAAAAHAAVTGHTYLGGTDNVVDAWLQAAWAAKGITYADILPGIAWGVVRFPARNDVVVTGATVEARMLKVYDPRDGTQTLGTPATYKYSANPVLALADFIASADYGKGETLDWSTVTTCANVADQVPSGGTAVRRSFGLMFDSATEVDAVEETLRAYAGVWVIREGGTVRFVADAPASPVFTFTNATPANYLLDSIEIEQRDQVHTPTLVTLKWTDTSVKPWKEATVTKPDGGPAAGLQWREEVVKMPGIQDAGFAARECLRRYNEYTLCDLTARLVASDEAIVLRRGDVVAVTDSAGFTAKPFRLLGHKPVALGRWAETLVEYDAACYSDELGTSPSNPDSTLPLPTNVPALTGLTAVEQTYQLETGLPASRVLVSWSAPTTFPFVRQYRIVLRVGAADVHSALVDGGATSYTTPALQEGQTYTVVAAIISTVGAVGDEVTTLVSVAGKAIVPGNVLSLSGFEVGGRVFLSWTRADNPTNPGTPDPDVWRYEVRRGTTSQAWGDAAVTVLDQTDGLRVVDEGAPAGTWRYHVKAIDSVGQYSTTAATKDITVSTDAAAFLVDSYDQTSPTLTNMASFRLAPTDLHTYYVTEDGVAFGTKFSSTLGSYTNPLAQTHSSVTSTWQGEAEDFGSLLGGQWTGTADVTDISGSHTSYFGYHASSTTLTYVAGLSQKVNARFAGLKHEALTTSTLLVTSPTQQIRLDAIPRSETGTTTSLNPGPRTVTLANSYIATKKLTVTALGNAAYFAIADNIVMGATSTFDVYVFDAAGAKVAGVTVLYEFQGV